MVLEVWVVDALREQGTGRGLQELVGAGGAVVSGPGMSYLGVVRQVNMHQVVHLSFSHFDVCMSYFKKFTMYK